MAVVTGDYILYSFYQDKNLLSECIKNYIQKKSNRQHVKAEIIENVAKQAANGLYEHSYDSFSLDKKILNLFDKFNLLKPDLFKQMKVTCAATHCHDESALNLIKEGALVFDEEPPEITTILDLILVDWKKSLKELIKHELGEKLLRKYAKKAQMAFNCALPYFKNLEDFRLVIRYYWNRRAQLYFDGRNKGFPYIIHRFTESGKIFKYGNIKNLKLTRTTQNFEDRNPPAPQKDVFLFLNTHDADRQAYDDDHDIFVNYKRNGMSSSQFYIEKHIDQFLRIRSYYAELDSIGTTDIQKSCNSKPHKCLPKEYRKMLWCDVAYKKYLHTYRLRIEVIKSGECFREEQFVAL